MPNQFIQCYNMKQFIEVCAGLAREGLTFDADAEDMKITLTGGY